MGTSYKSETRVGEKVYLLELDRIEDDGFSNYGIFTTKEAAVNIGERFDKEMCIYGYRVTGHTLNM